ncbi:hypothetical protein IG631_07518 [Alternaria alternata]|jgi:hypothetical protein|nr:hypothetical protein IG631_07518 [Alternaria alternata]
MMAPMAVGGARHGETDGQHEEPIDKMLIWGIGCKRKAPWRWRRAGSSKQHGTVEVAAGTSGSAGSLTIGNRGGGRGATLMLPCF